MLWHAFCQPSFLNANPFVICLKEEREIPALLMRVKRESKALLKEADY
jgi:hypothetical protein